MDAVVPVDCGEVDIQELEEIGHEFASKLTKIVSNIDVEKIVNIDISSA